MFPRLPLQPVVNPHTEVPTIGWKKPSNVLPTWKAAEQHAVHSKEEPSRETKFRWPRVAAQGI